MRDSAYQHEGSPDGRATTDAENDRVQLQKTFEFRGIARSGALESLAHDIAARLQRLDERIVRCHIVLEPAPASICGSFVVRIELTVPGAQVHADSRRADGSGHESVLQAMRDAYHDSRRQLLQLRVARESPASVR